MQTCCVARVRSMPCVFKSDSERDQPRRERTTSRPRRQQAFVVKSRRHDSRSCEWQRSGSNAKPPLADSPDMRRMGFRLDLARQGGADRLGTMRSALKTPTILRSRRTKKRNCSIERPPPLVDKALPSVVMERKRRPAGRSTSHPVVSRSIPECWSSSLSRSCGNLPATVQPTCVYTGENSCHALSHGKHTQR